jgi:hypothetical protein
MGGLIKKIHGAYVFNDTGVVFKEFISSFDELKATKQEWRVFAKTCINSFYGRLGMSNDGCTTVVLKNVEEFNNFKVECEGFKILSPYNFVMAKYKNEDCKSQKNLRAGSCDSNIIYASIITSKARIKLYKTFLYIIKAGGRILYCDTDGIYASFKDNLEFKIGGTRTNQKKIIDALFTSPKRYIIKYDDRSELRVGLNSLNNIDFNMVSRMFYSQDLKSFGGGNFSCLNELNKRKFSQDKKTTTPFLKNKYAYI